MASLWLNFTDSSSEASDDDIDDAVPDRGVPRRRRREPRDGDGRLAAERGRFRVRLPPQCGLHHRGRAGRPRRVPLHRPLGVRGSGNGMTGYILLVSLG